MGLKRREFSHSVAPHHFTWMKCIWELHHPFIPSSLPPLSFCLTRPRMLLLSGLHPHPLHLPFIPPSQWQVNTRRANWHQVINVYSWKGHIKDRKSFFRDWQPSIFKLQITLWTGLMGPWGQIAYLACAEISDIRTKQYKKMENLSEIQHDVNMGCRDGMPFLSFTVCN